MANTLATVQQFFIQHKDQLAAALPKHLNADRMARLALTALSQNRALADCDARSIFGAVVVASQLGLEIGILGQCYLVPYKGKATLIPGWQGLMDLVGRAGRASCWTGAVFAGDEFDWGLGDRPHVTHRPCGESDPTKITHVYAVGRVKGAEWPIIEVWPISRVWAHRDRYNKVGTSHYSFDHPEMYARKVVLLQVMKYLPKSIEISAAMEISYRGDEGKHATLNADFEVIDGDETEGATVTELNASLKSRPKGVAKEPEQTAAAPAPAKPDAAKATEKPQDAPKPEPMPTSKLERDPAPGPAPGPENDVLLDLLTLIADAETIGELDYIDKKDRSALSEKDQRAYAKAWTAQRNKVADTK